MTTHEVALAIAGTGPIRSNGRGWKVRCPVHDDHSPSLDVDPGTDGRTLVICRSCGAKGSDVVEKIPGLELADLMPERQSTNGKGPIAEVARYPYRDEDDRLLYEVVRFEPKTFRPRRVDPQRPGEWTWGLGDVRRIPYRLFELGMADPDAEVYVAEGERDVDAIRKAGGVATCNPGGAGKWRAEYAEHLRDRRVVIVADKHAPGRAHARQVAATLAGVARSVETCVAAVGKDAADHLAAGKTLDEFAELDASASESDRRKNAPIDWSRAWDQVSESGEWLVDDVLARGRGHAIWAKGGTGKSLHALWELLRALGPDVLIVYLDYEMGAPDVTERLSDFGYDQGDPRLAGLVYIPAETIDLAPLDTPEGEQELAELIDRHLADHPGAHLVVAIDSFGRAVKGPENDADTVHAFQRHGAKVLKHHGATWVRLDHTGWEGDHSRGTSAKYDDVDVVWQLVATDNGVRLDRKKHRMHWVPEHVTFRKIDASGDGPLRYERAAHLWPNGTRETAAELDALDMPLDVGERKAGSAVRAEGHKVSNEVVRAALKYRRGFDDDRADGGSWTAPEYRGADSGAPPAHPLRADSGAPPAHPSETRITKPSAQSRRSPAHPSSGSPAQRTAAAQTGRESRRVGPRFHPSDA